jgi:hypothetical protein
MNSLTGVVAVMYTGAGDHTRVRFDPERTTREIIIENGIGIAKNLMPGHSFS